MSHFTVLVKIKNEELQGKSVETILEKKLAPYKELYDKNSPFTEFSNKTEEVLRLSQEIIEADSYLAESRPDLIGKPRVEVYENLDKFAEDFFGYENNNGVYGSWKNPNGKWDWYTIGGRWRGLLPIKSECQSEAEQYLTSEVNFFIKEREDEPLTADVCLYKHLDVEKILQKTNKKIEDFWDRYQQWLFMKNEADLRHDVYTANNIVEEFKIVLENVFGGDVLNSFNYHLSNLNNVKILALIEKYLEPLDKQLAGQFRYLFGKKHVWENLKSNDILTENNLNLLAGKYKSEGCGEGTFSYKWSRLNFDTREELFDLGLIKLTKQREAVKDSEGNTVLVKDTWPMSPKDRMITLFDDPEFEYNLNFTIDDLKTKYAWAFEWSTWAVLDENGWHEKGEMGWWGMSNETQEDRKIWSKNYFNIHLKKEDPKTILVIVDCHI